MNDPETLNFYTIMQLFRNDPKNQGMVLQFPSMLSAEQRQKVCSLAIRLHLHLLSLGGPLERSIVVTCCQTALSMHHHTSLHSSGLYPLPSISEFGSTCSSPETQTNTEHLQPPLNLTTEPLLYPRRSRSTDSLPHRVSKT